jgi:hypothetical protein
MDLDSRARAENTPPKIAGILERSPKMSSTRFTGFAAIADSGVAGGRQTTTKMIAFG